MGVPTATGGGATSSLPPLEETGFESSESYTSSYSDYSSSSETSWIGQWGEVVFAGDGSVEEAYTGFVDFDGETVLCDVSYVLTRPTAATGCPGCDPALAFVLGRSEVAADEGGRCAELGWLELQGSALAVGHVAPERLWIEAGGNWAAAGWSDASPQYWEFEIPL